MDATPVKEITTRSLVSALSEAFTIAKFTLTQEQWFVKLAIQDFLCLLMASLVHQDSFKIARLTQLDQSHLAQYAKTTLSC
jgi:hypothetical protein